MFRRKSKNKSAADVYEHCEIVVTEPRYKVNRYTFRFFARAKSPKEVYTAGISKDCSGRQPHIDDKETQLNLNELRVKLVSEAWELMEKKGSLWYSLRFQRPYK